MASTNSLSAGFQCWVIWCYCSNSPSWLSILKDQEFTRESITTSSRRNNKELHLLHHHYNLRRGRSQGAATRLTNPCTVHVVLKVVLKVSVGIYTVVYTYRSQETTYIRLYSIISLHHRTSRAHIKVKVRTSKKRDDVTSTFNTPVSNKL